MSDEEDRKPDEGKDRAVQPEKRKTVRRLLTGGGVVTGAGAMGGQWSKPMIDKVMLPAHGQTTTPSLTPAPTGITQPTPQPTPAGSIVPTPLPTDG